MDVRGVLKEQLTHTCVCSLGTVTLLDAQLSLRSVHHPHQCLQPWGHVLLTALASVATLLCRCCRHDLR